MASKGNTKNSKGKFPHIHCTVTENSNNKENSKLVVNFINSGLVKQRQIYDLFVITTIFNYIKNRIHFHKKDICQILKK